MLSVRQKIFNQNRYSQTQTHKENCQSDTICQAGNCQTGNCQSNWKLSKLSIKRQLLITQVTVSQTENCQSRVIYTVKQAGNCQTGDCQMGNCQSNRQVSITWANVSQAEKCQPNSKLSTKQQTVNQTANCQPNSKDCQSHSKLTNREHVSIFRGVTSENERSFISADQIWS